MGKQVWFSEEPFASALAALEPMTFGERVRVGRGLLAMAAGERYELRDFAFGDTELTWVRAGQPDVSVALGYSGSPWPDLELFDGDVRVARWEADDALPLFELGRLAGRARNDETGDPEGLLVPLWLSAAADGVAAA